MRLTWFGAGSIQWHIFHYSIHVFDLEVLAMAIGPRFNTMSREHCYGAGIKNWHRNNALRACSWVN
jgi:hypothetical protein